MTQKSLTFDECKQLSSRLIAMNPNRRANMGQISSHLLDYYTELTKQPWLAQLVGQIRDLTAQQNQMMQQVADAVNAAQFENEDALAFVIIKKQEEMNTHWLTTFNCRRLNSQKLQLRRTICNQSLRFCHRSLPAPIKV